MPDRNTQWIIGTAVALAVALSMQIGGVREGVCSNRTAIENLRTELRAEIESVRTELRAEIDDLDARLRKVEVAFAKVDQRLATLERAILPAAPPAD